MENASKALLMAAGVLIGIMVLSLAAYLFVTFSQYYSDINRQKADQELANFNTQFTTYLHRDNLTIYDILTIVSQAKENNQKYEDENGIVHNGEEDNIITISLKRGSNTDYNIQEKGQDYFNQIIKQDQGTIKEEDTDLPKYKCTNITYNDEGRVKKIEIIRN